jgi:hypothetical protein
MIVANGLEPQLVAGVALAKAGDHLRHPAAILLREVDPGKG